MPVVCGSGHGRADYHMLLERDLACLALIPEVAHVLGWRAGGEPELAQGHGGAQGAGHDVPVHGAPDTHAAFSLFRDRRIPPG